jgi:hypothetical protein
MFIMSNLNYLLIVIGIIMVIISYNMRECPAPRIVYRYIPRTLAEEQQEPVSVEEIYANIFREREPQQGGFTDIYIPKIEVEG